MSTRGQNNIDKIRNLIEETEEQKKYELEQLNNTITNKLIKGAPLKEINLVNKALKLTNANIQNSLQTAQQTVKEVSKSGAAIKTTSASVAEANKNLASVTKAAELMKEYAPIMGGLSLATLPSTIMGAAKEAVKTRNNHEALVKAMHSQSVKPGQVAPSILNNTLKSGMKLAGVGAGASFAHDMFTTGTMGGLTKGLLGASNPGMLAAMPFGGMGGISGAMGLTGAAGIAAPIAMMMGAAMLHNKFSKMVDAKNPLNKNNVKSLATNINYRSISSDPIIQSERAVAKSKIQVLGPNGLGVLTQGELIQASLLADIVANTSILDSMYEELINRSEINNKGSNAAVNRASLDFGGSSQDGLEFNSLANGGNLNRIQRALIGLSGFNTQIGNVFGALSTIHNTTASNKGAWANRDAYLAGGDPDRAKKQVAKNFNITLAESSLLSYDITKTLESLTTPEERTLAVSIGIFKLNQLQAKKLVEMAKAQGASSFIGAQAKADKQAQLENEARYSYLIDGVLRSFDETLQKIPGLKLLSNVGHMGVGLINGVAGLRNAGGWVKGLFGDIKDSYQDNRLSDTVKNEKLLRDELGMNELDDTALAMAYLGRTYPEKFDQLLMKLGVDVKDSYTDKYTGDRVTSETLAERNMDRARRLKEAILEQAPEDSVSEWLKQATVGKIFNKNRENDIRRRYSHIGALGDELSQDPTLNNRTEDGMIADERPINFGGDANSDLFSAFSEFAKKYDENTNKAWGHCWEVKPCVDCAKESNYGLLQTTTAIAKALELTDSSESGKNIAAGTNLNNQMFNQEKLNREEMIAASILKYLPFLESIHENTKPKEAARAKYVEEDTGGIFDSLGSLFGGGGGLAAGAIGGVLLKKGWDKLKSKIVGMKNGLIKKLTKFAGKGLLKGIAGRMLAGIGAMALSPLAPIILGIASVGLTLFTIYDLFEEEIDNLFSGMWDWFSELMPNVASWIEKTIKNFKEGFKRAQDHFQNNSTNPSNNMLPPGVDGNGNTIEGVDPTTLAKEREEKLLDSFEAEYNDKAKKILNEEAKDKAKVVARDLEIKNKAQEQLIKNSEAQIEKLENLAKALNENSLSNNNVILDAVEKLSISTQAQVGATIDNAKLNAGLSATISDQLQNSNNESYVLDYNITSIFGQRQTFNITPKNYLN